MPGTASPAHLRIIRRAFARQMLAVAGVADDARLEAAFATVPRERFLGPPPWRILTFDRRHHALASADPLVVYQDALFTLAPERGVNNGSPALHAHWLHRLAPPAGTTVFHIGAGTGPPGRANPPTRST